MCMQIAAAMRPAYKKLQAAQFNSTTAIACLLARTVSEQPTLGLNARINSKPSWGHTAREAAHSFDAT
jgi:hypothetical protein